ncbi:Short-chain dehydrogenase/reductase SDR [Trinorchestia longiramus]|nr:Short-chain dehydrogenase/reductase SDR [Trinorchestia longiramus]
MLNYRFWSMMKNKKAIITGASDGIGRELAIQLSKRVDVILFGRNEQKLKDTMALCSGSPSIRIYDFSTPCDFSAENFTEVGLLINNAGVSHEFPDFFMNDTRSDQIVSVNCINTMRLTKAVMRTMAAQRRGQIVNIGSMLGRMPGPMLAVYSASKAFMRSWSESLFYEMKPHMVSVQMIDTGLVATRMSRIRVPNLFVPSAKRFAAAVIASIGDQKYTVPYLPHLVCDVILRVVPTELLGYFVLLYNNAKRKFALRRRSNKNKTD